MGRKYLLNSAVCFDGVTEKHTVSPDVWKREFWGFVDERFASTGIEYTSFIGYPETARVLSEFLGTSVPVSRESSEMKKGDVAFVVQLPYRVRDPKTKGDERGGKIEDYAFSIMKKLED